MAEALAHAMRARAQERMRLLMQLEAAESRVVAAVLERDKSRAELIAHIKDNAAVATGACTNAVAAATAARLSPHRLQRFWELTLTATEAAAATEAATEPKAASAEAATDAPMTPP
jgi:hypothetical protein